MYDKIFRLQGWKVAGPRIKEKVSLYVFILDILSGEISRILSNTTDLMILQNVVHRQTEIQEDIQ